MRRISLAFSLLLIFAALQIYAQKKIILGTYNTPVADVVISSLSPDANFGGSPNLDPYAWTQGGSLNIVRPLIRFDLSAIPAGAIIDEVLMVLYWDPFTHNGGKHAGQTDFSVSRVLEPWEEMKVTWNTQPAVSSKNRVAVPTAAYDQQNYVINVTELVKDILADSPAKNYGFLLQLNNETPYNAAFLASADNADPSRHPQLWVTYDDGFSGTGDNGLSAGDHRFSIRPNPASGVFSIIMEGVFSPDKFTADIFDMQGKLVLTEELAGSFSYVYANQLPAGIYILKIRNAAGYVQEQKIVMTK